MPDVPRPTVAEITKAFEARTTHQPQRRMGIPTRCVACHRWWGFDGCPERRWSEDVLDRMLPAEMRWRER